MDLLQEVEKFKREIGVRNGTPEQSMLILFAYAAAPALNRPSLLEFIEAFLGKPAQRASEAGSGLAKDGKFQFKPLGGSGDGTWQKVTIGISLATLNDLDSMLKGVHPLSKIVPDDQFTWEVGKELATCTVHFEDGMYMIISVARGSDYIGVEHCLIAKEEMIDTTGIPIQRPSILGTYESCAVDQEEGQPSKPTHIVEIVLYE